MHLAILILQLAFFIESAVGCGRESELTNVEIDWGKLHGTWYEVADIPKVSGPLCWNIEEFHPIKNGVRLTISQHEYWSDKVSQQPTHIEYVRNSGGLYSERSVNVTKFNNELESALNGRDGKEKTEILQKEDDLEFQHNSFFLTDYEKYFIVVYCLDPGFISFAMSSTPTISMELLEEITEALNEVGLKPPTITLNAGCVKNRYRQTSQK